MQPISAAGRQARQASCHPRARGPMATPAREGTNEESSMAERFKYESSPMSWSVVATIATHTRATLPC